jgi:peptidoglycan hydrolase-like protein with peptidoglycan-binding domain
MNAKKVLVGAAVSIAVIGGGISTADAAVKTHPQNCSKVFLHRGSHNNCVGLLQQILRNDGYYSDEIDNDYGPNTQAAVINFKQDMGESATDGVGPYTWNKVLTYSPS